MRHILGLNAGLLSAWLLASMVSAVSAAPAEKSCLDCHKKLISKRYIHSAISQFAKMEQGCSACHESPHGKNKGTKSLAGTVPDLCYQCHDKAKFTNNTVHPPVASGDCSICHSPHASDVQSLLSQPVPYLCHGCHEDRKDGKHILAGYGFGDAHPVQGKKDPLRSRRELGCNSCHDPHSSSLRYLFANESSSPGSLCLMCHRRVTVRP